LAEPIDDGDERQESLDYASLFDRAGRDLVFFGQLEPILVFRSSRAALGIIPRGINPAAPLALRFIASRRSFFHLHPVTIFLLGNPPHYKKRAAIALRPLCPLFASLTSKPRLFII
jgi:hypothetical protein